MRQQEVYYSISFSNLAFYPSFFLLNALVLLELVCYLLYLDNIFTHDLVEDEKKNIRHVLKSVMWLKYLIKI